MKKLKVLLIDDDQNLLKVTGYQLERSGYEVHTAVNGAVGLELFHRENFDIVVSDIEMPGMNGMAVLKEIRKSDELIPFIIITAFGTIDNALQASKNGADDYIIKPFSREQLLFAIDKNLKIKALQLENIQIKSNLAEQFKFENIVIRSPAMKNVLRQAAQAAPSEATILLLGESGTGKSLLAKTIHLNSLRADKPFITVNCPSIPENLLESELFGHTRGAFTGAVKDKKGKFELAEGGTIFLDEIGDLPKHLQAKLLMVIQERLVDRVGGSKPIPVDVRIIAATNRDLKKMVDENKFREDLYYRLSVFPITLPPLRSRKEEIPNLTEFLIRKYTTGRDLAIEPEFIEALQNYDWPGNVRELENIIERSIILCSDNTLSAAELPPFIRHTTTAMEQYNMPAIPLPDEGIALDDIEKKAIIHALQMCGHNKSKAAKWLRIDRHILLYRMKKLGIE